ncbi:MAG: hypothetical protein ABSG78_19610 [Verrucomicrobiota bacterium]
MILVFEVYVIDLAGGRDVWCEPARPEEREATKAQAVAQPPA